LLVQLATTNECKVGISMKNFGNKIKFKYSITLCFSFTNKIQYIGKLYNQLMQKSSPTLKIYYNWSI